MATAVAADACDGEIPKALLKRLLKAKLSSLDAARGITSVKDAQLSKDVLLAFSEAARVFIHFLTATANDLAKERKRSTIAVDDVIAALNELDLAELVEPLTESLQELKAEAALKSKRKAENAKRKADAGSPSPTPETDVEAGADGKRARALEPDREIADAYKSAEEDEQ
ncbi:hypothetical protein H632_c1157p1 [Helicosporidium sp. ATCC 50920]|nr:hypothetical protein H632_c1157p1 [Helicosporidium sp. ATCC 50920]|eukprot:KDD74652.1 hypothetical protein H632_c1157p1 [Helicosporidium sp. ATCC 50920]